MKKYSFLLFLIILSGCSCFHNSHHKSLSKYKLVTSDGGDKGFQTCKSVIVNNSSVEITAIGAGNEVLKPFKGKKSWFSGIEYAINQIQSGNLTGTWLDTCKLKIVYWRAVDKTLKNIQIDVMDAPEDEIVF